MVTLFWRSVSDYPWYPTSPNRVVSWYDILLLSFSNTGRSKATSAIEAARSHNAMLHAIRKREDEVLSAMPEWSEGTSTPMSRSVSDMQGPQVSKKILLKNAFADSLTKLHIAAYLTRHSTLSCILISSSLLLTPAFSIRVLSLVLVGLPGPRLLWVGSRSMT